MAFNPRVLELADVVSVHNDQVQRYGGHPGVRDFGLLQSALAMPRASFGGERLHRNLHEMAAAYAFHISQNQPFVDANKRTGLACALVFLDLNGVSPADPQETLYQATVDVASGSLDKTGLASLFRSLARY